MSDVKYKERIVAYLDILGFSSLVRKSTNDNEILKKIHKSLSHFAEEKRNINNNSNRFGDVICQYSTLSDCIVISYAFHKNSGAFFTILTDIYFLIAELSYLKIILRGGICIGKLYHDEENVFGPALVNAVDLEEKAAHFPRVIITDDDYRRGMAEGYLYSEEDEKEYINYRLKRDVDGFWYINFFEQKSEFDWSSDFTDYLENWRAIIVQGLEENKDNIHVYSKYCWLASKFNSAIKHQGESIKKIVF